MASLVPWFPEQGTIRRGYVVGQSMFVPIDITLAAPLDERPYAGWLYASIGLGVESGKRLDPFGITLHMIGPASLAEQTQKLIHEITGSAEPRVRDTQLGDELGGILSYQRSWREFARTTFLGQ